ncbi:MAG: hypothetical protein WCI56_02630 [Hyphomicrobiales bacterium]
MFLGSPTYTLIHVAISLVALAAGFVVLFGMFGSKRLNGWTALFLLTTVATSATGFGFPFSKLLPSHIVGIISLAVLAVAILARYPFHLAGSWCWVYVVSAALALYFNAFVGVVQSFQKIAFLQPLAPTQSEPPFLVAQLVLMGIFVVLGFIAVKKFHPAMA